MGRVFEAGQHVIRKHFDLPFYRTSKIEFVLVDERELTIKGQEILTLDKVAIRASFLV